MTDTIPLPDSIAPLPFYQVDEAYVTTEVAEVNTGIPIDSIFTHSHSTDTVYRTTLFTGHRLEPQHTELQAREQTGQAIWVFPVLVALCALICIYYRNHKLHLKEMLKSIVDGNTLDKTVRNTVHGIAFLPIVLLLAGTLAMAIWGIAMSRTGIAGYLQLTLAIAAAYMLRNGVLTALGTIFDRSQSMSAYITCNYGYHLLLASLLAPLLFAQAYIPGAANTVTFIIGGIVILIFILRFLKGAKLFLTISKGFSFFLFYYLCTVEMLPFLVMAKWFM